MKFSPNDTVGEIVAQAPLASEVFQRHKIDFCCGGNRLLSEAAAERGVKLDTLLAELNRVWEKTKEISERRDWQSAPLSELVDYVVTVHHGYLQKALPELSQLTTTTLRAHGANHSELARVHKIFHLIKADLEQHLILEEETVFPAVKGYEASGDVKLLDKAVAAIDRLEQEHTDVGGLLAELRSLTADYELPNDACSTYADTYRKLAELEADLHHHIHLENNILHPRLAKKLQLH